MTAKKELHFVLLGDIGLERPSIGGRDQNGKIIEEIITCFTLQTTLTRSSIEKAHRTQCQDEVRTYSAGTHILKVVKWG